MKVFLNYFKDFKNCIIKQHKKRQWYHHAQHHSSHHKLNVICKSKSLLFILRQKILLTYSNIKVNINVIQFQNLLSNWSKSHSIHKICLHHDIISVKNVICDNYFNINSFNLFVSTFEIICQRLTMFFMFSLNHNIHTDFHIERQH